MEPELIFAQEIYTDTLDNIDCEQLKVVVLKMREENPGVNISNVLGWQSAAMNDKSSGYENFLLLIETVKTGINQIIENRYKLDKEIKLSNFWININGKYAYNTEHSHPKTLFSAVFYIEHEPEMGNLIMVRGDKEISMFNTDYGIVGINAVMGDEYTFKPKKNKLIVFPGWYRHRVESNMLDKERISIAMNFTI
jgi:uncharacterized protein (TIGR02466 family)